MFVISAYPLERPKRQVIGTGEMKFNVAVALVLAGRKPKFPPDRFQKHNKSPKALFDIWQPLGYLALRVDPFGRGVLSQPVRQPDRFIPGELGRKCKTDAVLTSATGRQRIRRRDLGRTKFRV